MKPALIFALALSFSSIFGQNPQDLNVDYMLNSQIHAQFGVKGEAIEFALTNLNPKPNQTKKGPNVSEPKFSLKVDTIQSKIIADKYYGYPLYVTNTVSDSLKIIAQDGRLDIIAEAFYKDKWSAIEYFPSSWCGNSYAAYYIKPGQFWTVIVPKLSGSIKTRIRYRLTISHEKYIYSNEIRAGVNEGQFTFKNGDELKNPYTD